MDTTGQKGRLKNICISMGGLVPEGVVQEYGLRHQQVLCRISMARSLLLTYLPPNKLTTSNLSIKKKCVIPKQSKTTIKI